MDLGDAAAAVAELLGAAGGGLGSLLAMFTLRWVGLGWVVV